MIEAEKAYGANVEVQGLEGVVLVGDDTELIDRPIHLSASFSCVHVVCVYRTLIK